MISHQNTAFSCAEFTSSCCEIFKATVMKQLDKWNIKNLDVCSFIPSPRDRALARLRCWQICEFVSRKSSLKLCQLISSLILLKAPAEIQILKLLQYLLCMCDELFSLWLVYSSFHVQRCPQRLSSPSNL